MKLIRQETDWGCGQACVATLAGVDFDSACVVTAKFEATTASDLRNALRWLGWTVAPRIRRLPRASRPPTQSIVFLQEHGRRGVGHWVVWDGERVLDPDRGIFELRDYRHWRYATRYLPVTSTVDAVTDAPCTEGGSDKQATRAIRRQRVRKGKDNSMEPLQDLQANAEQGDPGAEFELGNHFKYGNGVTQDFDEAARWFRLAAEQGHPLAQVKLGYMYNFGEGIDLSLSQAFYWYSKAADQGNPAAEFNLGRMYQGGEHVAQDATKAVRFFRRAAARGYAIAQLELGIIYEEGLGVKKDAAESIRWYAQAAGHGNTEAQYRLGVAHRDGNGVKTSLPLAAKWLRKAAELGHPGAQVDLGAMYANGEGVDQDWTVAARWFRRAAIQGNSAAQFNLGLVNDDEETFVFAYMWFELAAADAEIEEEFGALDARDRVAQKMTARQIAEAQRLVKAWKPTIEKDAPPLT